MKYLDLGLSDMHKAFLQMRLVCLLMIILPGTLWAPHDSLAYKNCRGVYELMTGNTYEGIRMLKAAKTEGSEEASYNLNVFFENNKRP